MAVHGHRLLCMHAASFNNITPTSLLFSCQTKPRRNAVACLLFNKWFGVAWRGVPVSLRMLLLHRLCYCRCECNIIHTITTPERHQKKSRSDKFLRLSESETNWLGKKHLYIILNNLSLSISFSLYRLHVCNSYYRLEIRNNINTQPFETNRLRHFVYSFLSPKVRSCLTF